MIHSIGIGIMAGAFCCLADYIRTGDVPFKFIFCIGFSLGMVMIWKQ